jgi:hypothetical protein
MRGIARCPKETPKSSLIAYVFIVFLSKVLTSPKPHLKMGLDVFGSWLTKFLPHRRRFT